MKVSKPILLVGLGLVTVIAVFAIAVMNHVDYSGAKEQAEKVAATRGSVEAFLDAEEYEQGKGEAFESAVSSAREAMTKLSESSATKDAKVKEGVEQAQSEFKKMESLDKIWEDTKLLNDLSDENITRLQQSESRYLAELGKDMAALRKKFADYKEKYGSGKEQSEELITAFGEVWNEGEKLEQKVGKVSVEDITGMSRDDIMQFYAKIEELTKYLAEK